VAPARKFDPRNVNNSERVLDAIDAASGILGSMDAKPMPL
jgi:hypothetical protein